MASEGVTSASIDKEGEEEEGRGKQRQSSKKSSSLPPLPVIESVDDFSNRVGLVIGPISDRSSDPWWRRVVMFPLRTLRLGQ